MTDDDREDPNPRATVPDIEAVLPWCSKCQGYHAPGRGLCGATNILVQQDHSVPPGALVVKNADGSVVFSRGGQSVRVTAEEIAQFAAEYARRMGVAK